VVARVIRWREGTSGTGAPVASSGSRVEAKPKIPPL
jgi:hypothetical protein